MTMADDIPLTGTVPGFDLLVFDLGKVVIDFEPMRALRRLDGKSPHAPEAILARLRATDVMARFEKGQIDTPAFYREIVRLLDLDLDLETHPESP